MLPVELIAEKYGNNGNIQEFIRRGKELGGEQFSFGDASVQLLPFPRIPVVLILWKKDEEFQARANLLLDSTCELQLPVDIIWSTAMMSLLIML